VVRQEEGKETGRESESESDPALAFGVRAGLTVLRPSFKGISEWVQVSCRSGSECCVSEPRLRLLCSLCDPERW